MPAHVVDPVLYVFPGPPHVLLLVVPHHLSQLRDLVPLRVTWKTLP